MIDVMIITYNEAVNLPRCLAGLTGWTRRVFVIDSGSTDGTQDIAREYGAQVVHHDWEGYAAQKNWGLTNLPLEAPWTLILDADEVITPTLREKLVAIASRPVDSVEENGFFLNRMTYFMNRPIRHCGYYPSWNMRFFKRGAAKYENRVVHEHMVIDGRVGYIRSPMTHDDRRGLEHYVAKHNRYSTLEAQALFTEMRGRVSVPVAKLTRETNMKRWLKRNVLPRVPLPWLWRFLYMYVLRLGVLDGRAGLEFCKFISMYDYLVVMKLYALRRMSRVDPDYHLDGQIGVTSSTSRKVVEAQVPASALASREDVSKSVETAVESATTGLISTASDRHVSRSSKERVAGGMNVSILILTLNEESNIAACLDSVREFDDIIVFDSYSSDCTTEIAKSKGARVVQRRFDNWSAHQNWAMENIDFKHEWVFYLDADERMTPELLEELRELANNHNERRVAFYCGRRNYFMGKWIKRSMPPGLIMRFFRPQYIRFERLVNPTPVINGEYGYLKNYFDHYNFSKGITEWLDKHNKYSRMEAMEGLKLLRGELDEQPSIWNRDRALRRKALKNLSFRLPFRPAIKFLYMYVVRLGFLDGKAGLTYCILQAQYEYMIVVKMRELKRVESGLPI